MFPTTLLTQPLIDAERPTSYVWKASSASVTIHDMDHDASQDSRFDRDAMRDTTRDSRFERLSVSEAAERLGISTGAVRKRVERGTMEADKDEDGRLFVYLDTTETIRTTRDDESRDTLNVELRARVEELRDQVEFLRREVERKDAILLNMTEGLKSLEAPREPQELSVSASEEEGKGEVSSETEHRSWWQRLFGG